MDNIKNIVITAVVVGGLAIGIVSVAKTQNITLNASPNVSSPGMNGARGSDGQSFAGIGPVSNYDYSINGGVKNSYRYAEFTATSSVICKLQAPSNATSTPTSITVKTDSILIPGSQVFYVSTSSVASNGFASSTPAFIGNYAIATTSPAFWLYPGIIASTTAGVWGASDKINGTPTLVMYPNEWITVRVATSSAGTFAAGYLTGSCSAEFREY